MFLRKNRKSANGEVYEYCTLCETAGTELGPRQRVVATLGKLSDQNLAAGRQDIGALLEGRKPAPHHTGAQQVIRMTDSRGGALIAPDSAVKPGSALNEGESNPFTQITWCGIIRCMRTTLDIEEDVLQAAKELAQREKSTAGQIISRLARRGLSISGDMSTKSPVIRGGVPLLQSRGEVVTLGRVQKLMDQEGI